MTQVRIYNTLSRNVEPLEPRQDRKVGVYCCGPTVYDVPHAGHARSAIAFDVLVRHLRARGFDVTYVRNITDIDDKILARAKENGEEPLALSQRMAEVYRQQIGAVGCQSPTHEPKVSDHLPEIFAIVEKLVERGAAYVVDMPGGTRDVYFSVRSFPGYGKLSRRKIDELVSGARVEKDETKRDPLDFALWKGAPEDEWGWKSPWGHGRPGWHIECSAMSGKYLGHGFDIHAGGMDLIFPHHENEIAQSEAAEPEGGDFARAWMHNGFVNVDKEKMSKSLGNFVTVRDVLERNDPEAFRWFLMTVHYRGPIQFDTDKLEDGRVVFPGVDEAERRVDYVYATLGRLAELSAEASGVPDKLAPELTEPRIALGKAMQRAQDALDDDLNTSVALAELGELARLGNDVCDLAQKRRKDAAFVTGARAVGAEALGLIEALGRQLGLLQVSREAYAARTRERRMRLRGLSAQDIEAKIAERTAARQGKDFARADAIRQELAARGVSLRDGTSGTDWTVEA
ncbi:MAG: cysteine--tRNA ligase [Polyangiaceae bacterium]|nr:cysteine--tRNA ligase [Polyangiaceae bacterium]MCE7891886.1 cysteine--tRNA ligase [Sorangiineae bacterium PRO1]MCL4756076.1 cysteine--tRNA ligase [Myxococcales bacterium]